MLFVLGLVLGMLFGVVASLAAWWILYRGVVPKIGWSTGICRTPGSQLEYRVKFGNLGRRDVVDVNVKCTMRIRNLDCLPQGSPRSSNYATIDIPLRGGTVDVLPRAGPRDVPASVDPTQDRRSINRNRVAHLLTSNISEFQARRLPSLLRERVLQHEMIPLEELFDQGDDAYIDFTFYCYDGYTGARRVQRSLKYRKDDVQVGRFQRQGFEIIGANS